MTIPRLTRRRALTGAAWTAPVIVVATAAPALAASPTSSLVLNRGTSGVVLGTGENASYYDLDFVGLGVVVPQALGSGQLSLTVTFTPATPGGPSNLSVFATPDPAFGFTVDPAEGGTASSVVLLHGRSVTAGQEVQLDGGFLGSALPTNVQSGRFVVTASAPGLTSAGQTFTTPPATATRQARRTGLRVVSRP